MLNHKALRNQLAQLGITKAATENMTSEGHPAIMVRWNGDEEIFTGFDPINSDDREAVAERVARFEDNKIS